MLRGFGLWVLWNKYEVHTEGFRALGSLESIDAGHRGQ